MNNPLTQPNLMNKNNEKQTHPKIQIRSKSTTTTTVNTATRTPPRNQKTTTTKETTAGEKGDGSDGGVENNFQRTTSTDLHRA